MAGAAEQGGPRATRPNRSGLALPALSKAEGSAAQGYRPEGGASIRSTIVTPVCGCVLAGLLAAGNAWAQDAQGSIVGWASQVVGVDLSTVFAVPVTQKEDETCAGSQEEYWSH